MTGYAKYIFAAILLLAAVVRTDNLAGVPPHLSNDEISIAYDAYSIVRTGRDEHAAALPLSFQSHGTYKAPVYAYLLAPLTLLLPSSSVTAKLPSVICGVLTVFFLGLIVYELTGDLRFGLTGSAVLAVTPWHIYTSRMVLEANVALMFLSLGLLLLFKKKYIVADLMLVLSMYAYHTEWLLVPFIILLFTLRFLKNSTRKLAISLGFSFLLALPLIFTFWADRNTGARANTEAVWQETRISSEIAQEGNVLKKAGIIAGSFITNYFSYTNPGYLFFSGLRLFPAPGPFEQGLFLWPMIIPFFLGLTNLKKIKPEFRLVFIIWVLVSPVVTALTHDGNIIRNLVSVLPYTVLIVLGFACLVSRVRLWLPLHLLLLILSFILFEMVYMVHYPLARAESFQGYQPLAAYLNASDLKNSRIKIDFRFGIYSQYIGVPHLYFGYYNRWNPKLIQSRTNDSGGWYYGNFQVTWIDWNRDPVEPGCLYIVSVSNRPTPGALKHLVFVKSFVDVAGMPSFEIWRGY